MSHDFKNLLEPSTVIEPDAKPMRAPPVSRKKLAQEEEDARWAEYGRAVFLHLSQRPRLEQVINRAMLQPGASFKSVAAYIRVYLTTGAMP